LIHARNFIPFRELVLPAAGTDYCSCQVLRENFCDPVESRLKRNLPLETLLLQQFFLFREAIILFSGECFAIPDSISVVPGLKDFSIVDPNNF
jgi:hypothetical protein